MGQRFVVTEVRTSADGKFLNAHQSVCGLEKAIAITPQRWWDGSSNRDTLSGLEVGHFASHYAQHQENIVYFYVTRIK